MQRDVSNYRTVVDQVAKSDPMTQLIPKIGEEILRQGQEAKITENLSAVELDLNTLNNQYQIDNEGDPFKNIEQLKEGRQAIFDKYGEDISPFYKSAWLENTKNISKRSDEFTQAWGFKQTRVNTVNSINSTIKNNMLAASIAGEQFGNSSETSIESYVNFQAQKEPLKEYGIKNLGEESTNKLLEDYDKDYLKTFLVGVAQTNPAKARQFLDSEAVTNTLNSVEKLEISSLTKRVERIQKLDTEKVQNKASGELIDFIYQDEGGSYFDKRLTIDKMEFEGTIKPKIAAQARRVLTSQKNIDAQSNTDEMADIVTRVYDLNALQESDSQGYLEGVENIKEEILSKQADGRLSSMDAQKLNNQITTLTNAKMAGATQQVAIDFNGANDMFVSLPPEYRGKATRELFTQTHGKELNKEGFDRYARDIINTINYDKRTAAVKKIEDLKKPFDEGFMSQHGITMDDINETAEKYNLTPNEVYWQLKGSLK